MNDLLTICPVCEQDVKLAGREIKLAINHKDLTNGLALVGCPYCARVLQLPKEMAAQNDDVQLNQYLTSVESCCCVPMLDDTKIREPAGSVMEMRVKKYRPGGGGTALPKRKYMLAYGTDPEIAQAMKGSSQEPFKI